MGICSVLASPAFADGPSQDANPENGGQVAFFNGSQGMVDNVSGCGDQTISTVASGDKTLIKLQSNATDGSFGIWGHLDGSVNAADMKYLEFWVDASSIAEALAMQLRVFDTDNGCADIYGASDNTDYYLLLNGEWEKHTVSYSVISLPAGFRGYVRVDMTQFKDAITVYIGNGSSLNLSAVTAMWLWFMQSPNTQGKSVYLNDFAFVADIAAPVGGLVEIDGELYYRENGVGVMAGLVKVGDDYYFAGWNGKIVKNKLQNIWANATGEDALNGKNRAFGADGKLLTGILNDVYYKDGVATMAGLVEVDGDLYFASGAGQIVKNKLQNVWANSTDDASFTGKNRAFGADGKLLTGILNDVYYKDGAATMAGLVEVDGDLYFASGAGRIVKDKVQYIWANSTDNTDLTETNQTFGADGKMIVG